MSNGWSEPTDSISAARRAGGRARYHKQRQIERQLRQADVLRLAGIYGLLNKGTQAKIAKALQVTRTTIHRDFKAIFNNAPQERANT